MTHTIDLMMSATPQEEKQSLKGGVKKNPLLLLFWGNGWVIEHIIVLIHMFEI